MANVLRVPVIRLVALRRYITARSGLVPYGSFVIGWCGFQLPGCSIAFTRLPYLNRHEVTITFPFVVSLSNHERRTDKSCRINSARAQEGTRTRRAAAALKSARE